MYKKEHEILFAPMNIGKVEIKNRFSMAPMGNFGMVNPDGSWNERGIEYYVERAKGGMGLIITGICYANNELEELLPSAIPVVLKNPVHFMGQAVTMVDRVHSYGTKIFMQLTAGFGRAGIPHLLDKKVAPSEISNRWNENIEHRELTIEEIQNYIKKFAQCAAIAKKCGFDGVEIHAVHEGYLLDQFAIALYNKRTDEYGGDLKGRLKFATDIVKAIKAVCGEDFPVSLRYSLKSFVKDYRQGAVPGEVFDEKGRDYEEGIEAAKILVEAGYDALNVDAGTYDSWYWNHPPMYFEDGMYLPFSEIVKKHVDVPVITAGRMDNPDLASEAINSGKTDFIGLGRPVLADPQLPNKVKRGLVHKIRPCTSCQDGCISHIQNGKGRKGCGVNPASCREAEYPILPALKKKKVVVIGGGPGGMEAARVCAIRGYEVTLFEKSHRLGGNLIPAGAPDFKHHDIRLIDWYQSELEDYKVDVRYNTLATKEMVQAEQPDVIFVATGSNPIMLNLEGKEHKVVMGATDVLVDESKLHGEKFVVVGAGLVGCETALWLARKGLEVTMVEAANQILGGPEAMAFPNYDMLKDLLNFNNVTIMKETYIEGITQEGARVRDKEGEKIVEADSILIAVGYTSENALFKELEFEAEDVFNIGDSKQVKNIMTAIWDAYEIARSI